MNLKLGKPNLEIFAETLTEIAEKNRDILVVTGDSRGSAMLVPFSERLPEQIVEVGIAEQNLVGISAGLASTGKIVYAVTYASFLTARALEQIKNDVCYSDNPVKLIGISAGVSYGALGSTHHSLHDIAALRAINNISIIVPADNFETRWAIQKTVEMEHPVYVRFGKKPLYHLHNADTKFEVGKAVIVREGDDVCFLATGETVWRAYGAAEELAKEGINSRVLSFHTVKPLDANAVMKAGKECRAVITVEEHRVYGGFGEACAATLLQSGINVPFKIVGIPDEYTVTGSQQEIFEHYGISVKGLFKTAKYLLDKDKINVKNFAS